jgi:hypothetical protein
MRVRDRVKDKSEGERDGDMGETTKAAEYSEALRFIALSTNASALTCIMQNR